MNSQRFTAVLFGLALLLGLLSALDVVAPDLGDPPTLTTAEAARSGSWTCSAAGLSQGATVEMTASAAPGGLASSTAASDETSPTSVDPAGGTGVAAEVTYDRFAAGAEARVDRAAPFPEQSATTAIAHPDFPVARVEFGVSARWRRQPAAVGRTWERSAEFGPAGLLSAPCVPGSSAVWVLPGLSTAGGAEATVVLSNPFGTDASVTMTLATTTGPEQPSLLENVVVPANSVRLLALNEHAPERRDVGVIVTARSGRVVVEALQSINAAIGGIEGVTVVRAAPAGAATWTIPWVAMSPAPAAVGTSPLDPDGSASVDDEPTSSSSDGAGSADQDGVLTPTGDAQMVTREGLDGTPSSWIWVTNVDVDDAILLVTVHGPNGGELVDLGETILAPGAVRRIDLDGLTPHARAAVTVGTENGVNIVASVGTQVADSDEDRTGIAVQLGAADPDPIWVLPGEAPAGRRQVLSLVNPGGEVATVAISMWTSEGIVRPASAQLIEVPPGTQRLVDLANVLDVSLSSSVVFVQAISGAVVAGRVGFADEARLDLIANVGVPSSVWRGGTLVPVTRFDPYLTGEVVPAAE